MHTVINNNQQTPYFEARYRAKTIGQVCRDRGINPNAVLGSGAALTGILASVTMFKPDLVTNPEIVKPSLFAGMASMFGLMAGNTMADRRAEREEEEAEQAEKQKVEDRIAKEQKENSARKNVITDKVYGKMALTDKGLEQYLKLHATIDKSNAHIVAITKSGNIPTPEYQAAATFSDKCINTLSQLGELPDVISNISNTQLASKSPTPELKSNSNF